jgi:hypothetical protein
MHTIYSIRHSTEWHHATHYDTIRINRIRQEVFFPSQNAFPDAMFKRQRHSFLFLNIRYVEGEQMITPTMTLFKLNS